MRHTKLAGNNDVIVFYKHLNSHAAIFVSLQAVRDNCVSNLIANFVGVSRRHLLTRNNVALTIGDIIVNAGVAVIVIAAVFTVVFTIHTHDESKSLFLSLLLLIC